MFRLTRIFSALALLILCAFAVSCDDDDAGCANYFLTEAANTGYVDKFYYNDDGLVAVILQSVDGNSPRRDEYSYNANRQLIRVDVHDFIYNTFTYDDNGRIEFIRMFSTDTDDISREIKYFYGVDNKISKREFHQPELAYYELYEYPSDNVMKVRTFNIDDEGIEEEEASIIYTMDGKPNAYPKEYDLEVAAWGGIMTPHNVTSYQVVDNGVVDATRSFTTSYEYNEGGYPRSSSIMGIVANTFTYSCEPVKEP